MSMLNIARELYLDIHGSFPKNKDASPEISKLEKGLQEAYDKDGWEGVFSFEQMEKRSHLVSSIPQQSRRQDALNDQLMDLMCVADRLGMYDAATLIGTILEKRG